MNTVFWVTSLTALVRVQAQPDVNVRFLQSYLEIAELDPLRITCEVNRTLLDLVNDIDVEIVRQSADNDTETVLSRGARKLASEADFYSVMVSENPGLGVNIRFEFLKVRRQDEGKYLCRMTQNSNGQVLGEDSLQIVIFKAVKNIYLKFGTSHQISSSNVDPVEVDPGRYTVVCTAEGSNPAATVRLYLDGTLIEETETQTDKMESHLEEFRTLVTGNVSLKVSNKPRTVECVAETRIGNKSSIKFLFKTRVYDAEISCSDSEAYTGQRNVLITCTVDYEGLNILSFKYQFPGETLQQAGQISSTAGEVLQESLSDTKIIVRLRLVQVEEWYFDSNFHLLVELKDGHITKQSVRLNKTPGYGTFTESGANPLRTVPVITLLFSLMMCLL